MSTEPIWCQIIFKASSTPKDFPDVRRMYEKGSYTCFELADKDPAGRPIIMRYPTWDIFSLGGPHADHVGGEPRGE